MVCSNALGAAALNMCSGNVSLKKQEKGLPSPSAQPLAPAVLNSNKAAQQPLFPLQSGTGCNSWGTIALGVTPRARDMLQLH